MQDNDASQYEAYYERTMQLMQKEFDYYEEQFQKILDLIGISQETFDMSKELYISGEGFMA